MNSSASGNAVETAAKTVQRVLVGLLVGTDALNFARTADETAAKTVAETVQIVLVGMVVRLLHRPLLEC